MLLHRKLGILLGLWTFVFGALPASAAEITRLRRIFDFARVFRNRERGVLHAPEAAK